MSVASRLDNLWQSVRDAALAVTLSTMMRAHCFQTLSDAPRGHIVRGPPSLFRLSVQLCAVVCDSYVMCSMEHSDSLLSALDSNAASSNCVHVSDWATIAFRTEI